jgi:S-formylglutathione hydrolase FrmB
MFVSLILAGVSFLPESDAPAPTTQKGLTFELRVPSSLPVAPRDGRLLVVIARRTNPEPRVMLGDAEFFSADSPPVLGLDAMGFGPGSVARVDGSATTFPIGELSRLARGEYVVQAVFHANRDLNRPDAPGNLYSNPVRMSLDPARGGNFPLELSNIIPPDEPPPDTDFVKYIKLKSELLSQFHGRPMYLRAAVILPRDFDREPERRYPLRVHIGGYGTRYTAAGRMMIPRSFFRRAWLDDKAPRMLLLHLDGAGPYGDPYQVNSDNNGPYGDALTRELIPYVEKRFRGIGEGYARFTDGASTGGWVSFALQVFYPDFFNGCWSHAPDPVDFRAYELIDIYDDENAYVNRHGFERPSARDISGEVRYTVRHECQLENVLGRGSRWWVSGKDWCAWNAVFGPRGGDGLPKPLWDGRTGVIDHSVCEHWKRYDLRLVLEENWAMLGPKLRGKLHIWVGDADDYFLNNAVHLLDRSLRDLQPASDGKITYGPRGGHGYRVITERQLLEEMAQAAAKQGR